jgi:hypothetical protein
VVVPVPDLAALGRHRRPVRRAAGDPRRTSIWPHVEERIVDRDRGPPQHAGLRQLAVASPSGSPPGSTRSPAGVWTHRRGYVGAAGPPRRRVARQLASPENASAGAPAVLARAHHGSVCNEQRARSRRPSRRAGCPRSSRRAASSWASTWAPSTSSSRSRRPRQRGLRPAARRARRSPGRGRQSRGVLPEAPRRPGRQTAVIVERMRAGRIEALASRQPPRRARPAGRRDGALDDWAVDDLDVVRRGRAVRDAHPRRPRGGPRHADRAATRARSSPSCAPPRLGSAHRHPDGRRARSGSPSPAAAPSPTAACSGCSSPGTARAAGWASSTRRWCTNRASGTSSRWAPQSWRIEDITHDQVLVTPAPGQAARLPFWKGDTLGRPAELGAAVGASSARGRLAAHGRPGAIGRASDWTRGRPTTCSAISPSSGRRPARVPTDTTHRGGAVHRRARRLADRDPLPLRSAGARAVGARDRRPAAGAARRRRPGHARRRRHRAAAARLGDPDDERRPRSDLPADLLDHPARPRRRTRPRHRTAGRLGAVRGPVPRMCAAEPCCCRTGATPGSARRCGSSGSARRSCWRWPASTPRSRSCWRRCASACRTSSTCRPSST